jgi:signal transduction histidine kinase
MEMILGGIGLRRQIGLVGLLGTAIMVAVATLIYASMRHQEVQQRIMDRAVTTNDLVSEMNIGLLQARRYEKDFLLHNDGEAAGRQRQAIAKVGAAIERLEALLRDPDGFALAAALKSGVSGYAKRFDEMTALRSSLGMNEDVGLIGRMRDAVHAIEGMVKDLNEPQLEILMLTMRRHEKDFLGRGNSRDVDDFDATAGRLALAIGGAAIRDPARAELRGRLTEYQDRFHDVVQRSTAVAEAAKAMSDRYAALEPLLNRLIGETSTEYAASRSENAAARADMVNFVMAVLACGVVLLVMSAIIVSGTICRPLIELTASMKRLVASDFTVMIPHRGFGNEIGEMARAVQVFKENAIEKTRLDEAEKRHLESERKAAAAQRAFIATMSHEFRTPLTVIAGHAQQLAAKADIATPSEIKEHSGKVRAAVKRIQHLIDGILLSEKVQQSQIHFEPAPVDLLGLIERCRSRYHDIAPDRRFILKIEDLPPIIECDETLVDHLLDNIVSNAVKYSMRPGAIEIIGRREGFFAVICVADSGEGIAEDDLAFVFDRYFRGKNAHRTAGFGIGLHLANTIAILHEGSIGVTSTLGMGSAFTVKLPITRPDADRETLRV